MQQGGLGLNLNSRLFQLKPDTLSIVQPNTTAEGAKKGHLRVAGTGDQFETMRVTLLDTPVEQRSFYVGEAGQLNRVPENLHCYSRDMQFPDAKAKYPQAPSCANCPKGSWDAYRAAKDKGQVIGLKELIPPCDAFYYMALIDTEYKMPLQMFIRSKSKQPFEAGMKQLARRLAMLQAKNKRTPNVFDVSFTLSTTLITTGKFPSYVLKLSDFQGVTDEEKEAFGEVFASYTAQKANFQQATEENEALNADKKEIANTESSIDDAVLEGSYEDTLPTGEIPL